MRQPGQFCIGLFLDAVRLLCLLSGYTEGEIGKKDKNEISFCCNLILIDFYTKKLRKKPISIGCNP
jgi:hypothetical protein